MGLSPPRCHFPEDTCQQCQTPFVVPIITMKTGLSFQALALVVLGPKTKITED